MGTQTARYIAMTWDDAGKGHASRQPVSTDAQAKAFAAERGGVEVTLRSAATWMLVRTWRRDGDGWIKVA